MMTTEKARPDHAFGVLFRILDQSDNVRGTVEECARYATPDELRAIRAVAEATAEFEDQGHLFRSSS